MEKITFELRGDIINVAANLHCFTDVELGKFFREVLSREIKKQTKKSVRRK